MGFYKYLRELWKKPDSDLKEIQRQRLIEWRKQNSTCRIERPTRVDRARSLGYRAKTGFILVRQRVSRGGRQRPKIRKGRKPRRFGRVKTVSKNYQQIAEERAAKKYSNLEVLNSYYVGQDGSSYWYEVILVDKEHSQIKNDKKISWISKHTGRAFRGITSAGRKSRGLRRKGKGAEKVRPSLRANERKLR